MSSHMRTPAVSHVRTPAVSYQKNQSYKNQLLVIYLYSLLWKPTDNTEVQGSSSGRAFWGSGFAIGDRFSGLTLTIKMPIEPVSGDGSHREPSPWLTVFRGFGAQPWTSHVALAECILAMLYLASERKQNLQVLMIWCLLAHSVATLRPWGCGGHYWISRAGLIPSMTSLRVYLSLTAHCWVNYPWCEVARGAALHLVSGFCFFIILTGSG